MTFLEFEKFCRQNRLNVFTINDVKILLSDCSPEYLRLKLNRWKQKGYLKNLKRGLYVFADKKLDEFEITAKLITPAYISNETALSHYSLIPDVSAEVTAVTTKNTRHFQINHVSYHFYHLKQSLFTDFINLRDDIFIATPEKALLDYFYFKNPAKDSEFFTRLNKEILKDIDLKKIKKMAKKFPPYVQKLCSHLTTS